MDGRKKHRNAWWLTRYRPQVVQHCLKSSRVCVPNLMLNSSLCLLIYIFHEIHFFLGVRMSFRQKVILWILIGFSLNGDLMGCYGDTKPANCGNQYEVKAHRSQVFIFLQRFRSSNHSAIVFWFVCLGRSCPELWGIRAGCWSWSENKGTEHFHFVLDWISLLLLLIECVIPHCTSCCCLHFLLVEFACLLL